MSAGSETVDVKSLRSAEGKSGEVGIEVKRKTSSSGHVRKASESRLLE